MFGAKYVEKREPEPVGGASRATDRSLETAPVGVRGSKPRGGAMHGRPGRHSGSNGHAVDRGRSGSDGPKREAASEKAADPVSSDTRILKPMAKPWSPRSWPCPTIHFAKRRNGLPRGSSGRCSNRARCAGTEAHRTRMRTWRDQLCPIVIQHASGGNCEVRLTTSTGCGSNKCSFGICPISTPRLTPRP